MYLLLGIVLFPIFFFAEIIKKNKPKSFQSYWFALFNQTATEKQTWMIAHLLNNTYTDYLGYE